MTRQETRRQTTYKKEFKINLISFDVLLNDINNYKIINFKIL